MGKASSRKVARAAGIGGGRTGRGRKQLGWYLALAAVFLAGLGLVALSTLQRRDELAGANGPPRANQDHWHAAYGFFICDKFAPALNNDRDLHGIHTHKLPNSQTGDGVIHVHPFDSSTSGKNATLKAFAESAGFKITKTSLTIPNRKTLKNGDKCGKKPATLQLKVNGKAYKGDPLDLKFVDRQHITIAFVPAGTKIPDPPSVPQLDSLSDVNPAGSTSPGASTAPPGSPPGTVPGTSPSTTKGP